MNFSRHSHPHRGVLLLVILGLLAMFGLVAVTFVITTGHFRRSSQALHRVDQYRDDPKALLDEAFAQCVRGTNNVGSVMGPHSLLENMYGNDARMSYINTGGFYNFPVGTAAAPGQLFRFLAQTTLPATLPFPQPAPALQPGFQTGTPQAIMHPNRYPEQFAGSVLTFYNGRCAGLSARIVAVLQDIGGGTTKDFVVQTTGEMSFLLQQDLAEKTTIYYLINSMPFSGTGRGFDVSTPTASYQGLTAAYGGPGSTTPPPGLNNKPYALLPNPAYFPRTQAEAGWNPNYPDPAGPGGANPDYNAPDYQNMLLAMVRPPQNGDAVPVPIPSLHRPELAYYWSQADTTNWPAAMSYGSNPNNQSPQKAGNPLACRVILRPIMADHALPTGSTNDPQAFTGSNPNFNASWDGKLTNSATGPGQWDVDNDGDGIPDSIWVDLGLPARAGPDGKMYKPLFAILCTDLDGRLNLNAHGCLAQASAKYYQAGPASTTLGTVAGASFAGGASGTTSFSMPRGQGYGPAEINLSPLFTSTPSTSITQYSYLLAGNNGISLEGRYGEGAASTAGPFYQPGGAPYQNPVWINKNYYQFIYQFTSSSNNPFAYYSRYSSGSITSATIAAQYLSVYGTPPDPFGTSVAALDLVGRPIYGWTGSSATGQYWLNFWNGAATVNAPYEMNLARESAWRHYVNATTPVSVDNPFTPAELERMLRPYDVDSYGLVSDSSTASASGRPSRIISLTGATFAGGSGGGGSVSGGTSGLNAGNAAGGTPSLDALREMATTEAADVPCPSPALPRELFDPKGPLAGQVSSPASHFVDLIYDLLGGYNNATSSGNATFSNLITYFPRELLSGRRMDLNRPFGGGTATPSTFTTALGASTAYVVDAPPAVGTATPVAPTSGAPTAQQYTYNAGGHAFTSTTTAALDWANRRTVTYDTPRTQYARDLYLLAMMFAQLSNYYDPSWTTLYPSMTEAVATSYKDGPSAHALQDIKYNVTVAGSSKPVTLTAQQQLCRARALAQWAVNVVDFRDRDSIMTCFVYDPDPFTIQNLAASGSGKLAFQWRPKGNPTPGSDGINAPHVVWGCEPPSLLITETLALHDRRTQDTDVEVPNGSKPPYNNGRSMANTVYPPFNPQYPKPNVPDLDFDQVTRPQGSLFVELYNPTNPYDGPSPELETYDKTSASWSVDLSKTNSSNSPVWRMLIYAPGTLAPAPGAAGYYTPDPDDPLQVTNATFLNKNYVRYVYFTNAAPVNKGDATGAVSYYVGTLNYAVIPPGRYAIVGPGQPGSAAGKGDSNPGGTNQGTSVTCLGFDTATYPPYSNGHPAKGFYAAGTRRIQLVPSTTTSAKQVWIYSNGKVDDLSQTPLSTSIQQPLAIVVDSASTNTGAATARLSVSEPPSGYPVCGSAPGQPHEYYTSVSDTPLDMAGPFPTLLMQTKTIPCFGVVYLQRLANPTAAYDQYANPYRTIDSMQIDLTCFNGISSLTATTPETFTSGAADTGALTNVYFHTRERGYAFNQIASTSNPNGSNIWAHEPETLAMPAPAPKATPAAPAVLQLPGTKLPTGVSATTWAVPVPAPTPTSGIECFQAPFLHSFGYLNAAFAYPRSTAGSYVGAPQLPFPALAFNNRPFANPLELLLVPQCSSSQLLTTYPSTSTPLWSSFALASSATYNPFLATPSPANNYPAYGYLTNPFYVGSLLNLPPPQYVAGGAASPLARLLDYVEVPSPFVSARNQLDPTAFTATTANTANGASPDLPFFVPFNWVSNYRDPGKINLNTINAPQVWQGLTNYFPDVTSTALPTSTTAGANSLWGKFIQSRRGYTSTSNSILDFGTFNGGSGPVPYPTRFVNPFRGTAGAWLVPPMPTGSVVGGTGSNANALASQIAGEVNTGLLRGDPPGAPTRPLFQYDTGGAYSGLNTAGGVQLNDPTHPLNPDRNPMFRYQLIEKLSSTTTTRSSAYAVWITVGYFEARPGPVTQFHPDGYYLGQELGTDTGDIHRHRAFYIFDRSVPMGFVRGLDLNFDKGILIKRFIE
jgi:hypothetical protein